MKAALVEAQGEPIVIRDDVEIQDPGPGQVRVRVSHCGVCHSDLSIADGSFPSPLPVLLGHEAAGVVDAVGANVASLAPGDPVVPSAKVFVVMPTASTQTPGSPRTHQ